jgi:hypothetical protein
MRHDRIPPILCHPPALPPSTNPLDCQHGGDSIVRSPILWWRLFTLVVSLPHLRASKAPKYRVPCSEPWEDPFRNIARGWGPIPWTLWLRGRFGLFGSGAVRVKRGTARGLSEILPHVKIPRVPNAHPLQVDPGIGFLCTLEGFSLVSGCAVVRDRRELQTFAIIT